MARMVLSRWKRASFWGVLALLTLLGMEVISLLIIRVANPRMDEPIRRTSDILREQTDRITDLIESTNEYGRTVFDPVLGYRYRASFNDGDDHINSQGLRNLQEFSPAPAEGVIRVAAFGDSFAYCNEVGTHDSWPEVITNREPGVEVLNFGVGAYGTTQAYLRFVNEGIRFSPDVVIIGFAPVMMKRTVSVYRRFLVPDDYPLVKPRFSFDPTGEIVMIPSPLRQLSDYQRFIEDPEAIRELGDHDHWYRPSVYQNILFDYSATARLVVSLYVRLDNKYFNSDRIVRGGTFNESSSAFRIQTKLLQRFYAEALTSADLALVVFFPDESHLRSKVDGEPVVYDSLMVHLRARGVECVDLADSFVAAGDPSMISSWFMPDGHYSPSGNEIVATRLAEEIRSHFSEREATTRDGRPS